MGMKLFKGLWPSYWMHKVGFGALGILLLSLLALLLHAPPAMGESGVMITTDDSTGEVLPGDTVIFVLNINNTGDETDTITLNIMEDDHEWGTFNASGTQSHSITLEVSQTKKVEVNVTLPSQRAASTEERATLDKGQYNITIKAITGDGSDSDLQVLSVEILPVYPDLAITHMRVDNKYITKAPNVDDVVTFTVTVKNIGDGEVDGARLYIWNDNGPPDQMLRERSNKDYLVFDVAAFDEKTVRFKWEAQVGEWTGFRAEVNPKCNDIGESNDPDCDEVVSRFIDELDRYNNNEFPAGGAKFKQEVAGEDVTVEFLIWPDFIIKEVQMVPIQPERDGDSVTNKVTIENIGSADWTTGMGVLMLLIDDGAGWSEEISITKAIDASDDELFEVKRKWNTPDRSQVDLRFELDFDGGKDYDELDDSNNEYIDPETEEAGFQISLKDPDDDSSTVLVVVIIGLGIGVAAIGGLLMYSHRSPVEGAGWLQDGGTAQEPSLETAPIFVVCPFCNAQLTVPSSQSFLMTCGGCGGQFQADYGVAESKPD